MSFPTTNLRVWWVCEKDSTHEWQAQIKTRIETSGECPICKRRTTTQLPMLSEYDIELAKEWHPTKNGGLTPDQIRACSEIKVWWLCKNNKTHEWDASWNLLIKVFCDKNNQRVPRSSISKSNVATSRNFGFDRCPDSQWACQFTSGIERIAFVRRNFSSIYDALVHGQLDVSLKDLLTNSQDANWEKITGYEIHAVDATPNERMAAETCRTGEHLKAQQKTGAVWSQILVAGTAGAKRHVLGGARRHRAD